MLMAAVCVSAFPHIYFNRGECAFEGDCGAAGASGLFVPSGSGLMGMYLVEGAGYVLDARSGVSTFMNRFETAELTGVDFPEMSDILARAIDNLEKAKASYVFIHFIAKNTPYRVSVIERLKAFPYNDFQKRSGLYPKVFRRVKRYLKRGKVRRVFSVISKDLDLLLGQLTELKSSIDAGRLPEVQQVWRLNQSFSDNIFFGQYFAMVMYETK